MHIHSPATPLATSARASIPLYPLSVHINGVQQHLYVEAWVSLLDLLRDRLMLVDVKRINACLTLALMQEERNISTVEGLADCAALHPLQRAFIAHDAFQCGYCTSGQLCSGVGLIAEGQAHTRAQVRELIGKVSA